MDVDVKRLIADFESLRKLGLSTNQIYHPDPCKLSMPRPPLVWRRRDIFIRAENRTFSKLDSSTDQLPIMLTSLKLWEPTSDLSMQSQRILIA